jgi:dihydroorotase
MIVIAGGQVLTTEGWVVTDVVVENGLVSALGRQSDGDEVVDASGCLVGPGFVDMHTHLREPGQTWKEDIASGSAAAVAGGFTAITAMPNTDPPIDTPKVVESVATTAGEVDLVDVVVSGALSVGRAGTAVADLEGLYRAGVRLFSDDGDCLADITLIDEAMEVLAGLPGAVLAQHAEDPSLAAGGHMHEGPVSKGLGIRGLPSAAESEVVRRDISHAARFGVHYHCQHVSAKETVALIRTAKEQGLSVTAEVTPHHLSFDETHVAGLDPVYKMYPPLRSPEDRRVLVEALQDGTIDAVATDHAPHLPAEKEVPFADAPRGVIGLETATAAVWGVLGDRDRFFTAMSTAPARILGLGDHGRPLEPGVAANLVVFDPDAAWSPQAFRSKSQNSPYRGHAFTGRVMATMRRGRVVYRAEVR